jgi:hypothetical protein
MKLNGGAMLAKAVVVEAKIFFEIRRKQMAGRRRKLFDWVDFGSALAARELAASIAKCQAGQSINIATITQAPREF